MALKEKIAAASERRFKVVEIPEVGEVRLRSLKRSEFRRLAQSLSDDKGETIAHRQAKQEELFLALVIVDDQGVPTFSEDDVFAGVFDELDGGVMRVLLDAARQHTGVFGGDGWQAVESAAKN